MNPSHGCPAWGLRQKPLVSMPGERRRRPPPHQADVFLARTPGSRYPAWRDEESVQKSKCVLQPSRKGYCRNCFWAKRLTKRTQRGRRATHSFWAGKEKKQHANTSKKKAAEGYKRLLQQMPNNKRMQNFGESGNTVRYLKEALHRKLLDQNFGTLFSEMRPLMPREASASTHSSPASPAWPRSCAETCMLHFSWNRSSLQVRTSAIFLQTPATPSDTNHVFGVVKNAETSTAGDEAISPTKTLSKTSEFSGVVAARSGSWKRTMTRITHDKSAKNSNKVLAKRRQLPSRPIMCHRCCAWSHHLWRVSSRWTQNQSVW